MKKIIFILLCHVIAVFFVAGCRNETATLSFPMARMPKVSFQGYNIPQFPTAQSQLNYAKSGFPTAEEKEAAFRFLFHMFPQNREECGDAALHLAYMNFGFDYRFALLQDFHKAIKDYHTVIKEFKDHPQVLVKAYWYLGWIHCDLLNDKMKGLEYYWCLVQNFPDLEMGISSPVPWVSLVYPLTVKGDHPLKNKIKTKWASLALLEIIRHSPDNNEVFSAFDLMLNNYQKTVPAGLAIRLMLADKAKGPKAAPFVDAYLDLNIANRFLMQEIQSAAKGY